MTQTRKHYRKRNKTLKQFKLKIFIENFIHSQYRKCLTPFRSRLQASPSSDVYTYKEIQITGINKENT